MSELNFQNISSPKIGGISDRNDELTISIAKIWVI